MEQWKPYRPTKATEGYFFQSAWCDNCLFNDHEQGEGCRILTETMIYNLDDPEYPKEWQQNSAGEARCTKFKGME